MGNVEDTKDLIALVMALEGPAITKVIAAGLKGVIFLRPGLERKQ
jgi:hypothetical protein